VVAMAMPRVWANMRLTVTDFYGALLT